MKVKLNPELKRTKNLYGPQSEIEGQTLEVMEKSFTGDCLCFVAGENGRPKGIIDVWKEDIEDCWGEVKPMSSMSKGLSILKAMMNRSVS